MCVYEFLARTIPKEQSTPFLTSKSRVKHRGLISQMGMMVETLTNINLQDFALTCQTCFSGFHLKETWMCHMKDFGMYLSINGQL